MTIERYKCRLKELWLNYPLLFDLVDHYITEEYDTKEEHYQAVINFIEDTIKEVIRNMNYILCPICGYGFDYEKTQECPSCGNTIEDYLYEDC